MPQHDPSHCSDNTESLTCCAARELLGLIFRQCELLHLSLIFFFFFFFFGPCICDMQKLSGLESNPSHSSDNAKSLTARPPGNALFLILIKKCVYVEIRVCVAGQGPGIAALWVSTTSFGLAYHWVCPG